MNSLKTVCILIGLLIVCQPVFCGYDKKAKSKKKSVSIYSPNSGIGTAEDEPEPVKFKRGDLIYGLHGSRILYVKHVAAFSEANDKDSIYIDRYPVMSSEYPLFTECKRPIPEDNEKFINYLLLHPKYKKAVNAHSDIEEEATRSKIKGGLAWATDNGRKVHFILDDLDLQKVVYKPYIKSHIKPYEIFGTLSFTGSELRWIYRNRLSSNVEKNIQFWLKGEPVSPPWTKDFQFQSAVTYDAESLWASYIPGTSQVSRFSPDEINTITLLTLQAFFAQLKLRFCLQQLYLQQLTTDSNNNNLREDQYMPPLD